jgi:peroxiredoxin
VRLCTLLLLAAGLAITAAPAQGRPHGEPTGLATIHFDQAPPDFTFGTTTGGSEKLSGLVGKPVVINFWTTWCHVCIDEMPAFEQLQATYGSRVAFITLSNEPAGTASTYLAEHNLRLPLLEDPERAIFAAYSITQFPVTVVVNAAGRVSHVSVGELDWAELRAAVDGAFELGPRA